MPSGLPQEDTQSPSSKAAVIRILQILATLWHLTLPSPLALSSPATPPHQFSHTFGTMEVLRHLAWHPGGNSLLRVAARLAPLNLQMSVSKWPISKARPLPTVILWTLVLFYVFFFFTVITAYYILIAHLHTHTHACARKCKYHKNWALFLLTALAPVPKTGPGTQ